MTENTPQGWRDMAGAPKDETVVRLIFENGFECTGRFEAHEEWWLVNTHLETVGEEPLPTPKGWLPTGAGFTDSLVVSEEAGQKLISAIQGMTERTEELSMWDGVLALTAALPRAKTVEQVREEVIEELADIAAERDILACVDVGGKRTGPNLADWLRSQKGQTND